MTSPLPAGCVPLPVFVLSVQAFLSIPFSVRFQKQKKISWRAYVLLYIVVSYLFNSLCIIITAVPLPSNFVLLIDPRTRTNSLTSVFFFSCCCCCCYRIGGGEGLVHFPQILIPRKSMLHSSDLHELLVCRHTDCKGKKKCGRFGVPSHSAFLMEGQGGRWKKKTVSDPVP